MEHINYYLNIINTYLMGGKKRAYSIGMNDVGTWLVADTELEVATLVVVRYMLDKNLECIGSLHLIKYDYEAPQYVLANYDYY
jgi:hypothetical protein